MKKKVCRSCKVFVSGDKCQLCGKSNFATSFNGIIHFIDAQKSEIAKKMDVTANGEYAIKVR